MFKKNKKNGSKETVVFKKKNIAENTDSAEEVHNEPAAQALQTPEKKPEEKQPKVKVVKQKEVKQKKPKRVKEKAPKKNKRPKNQDPLAKRQNIFARAYLTILDWDLKRKIANHKVKFTLLLIAIIIACGVLRVIWQNNQIGTTFYQVQSNKVSNNIRVVCLADLHLKEFGNDNERLVKRIEELKPDIIAMAGDMNTYKIDDYESVLTLCKNLKDIAPIYYSLGNHEYEAMLFKKSKICDDLKDLGVHVLHNQSEEVTIGTSTINIGGLSESPKQFEQYGHKFFDKYAESEEFKLLLNHYPEAFLGMMDNYKVDLCLCGHAHGGQIRLPKIGGLYSADQGFLPELAEGMHVDEEGGGSTFIISRGLGNSSWIPRINNRPELIVADINWY